MQRERIFGLGSWIAVALLGAPGCTTPQTAPAPTARDVATDTADGGDAKDGAGASDVGDVPGAEVAMDVPPDMACVTPRVECGGRCVDTNTDVSNCGMCGRACRARGACIAGVCIEQRSCRTAGTPGCGVVDVAGNVPFTQGGDPALGSTPGQTNVRVGHFALDAYEVTVARFRVFWAARMADGGASIRVSPGVRYPDGTSIAWGANAGREPTLREPNGPLDSSYNWSATPGSPSREAHPINGVDWWTAQEFCVWDGGTGTYGTPSNGRLPTEAEWEYAARYRAVSGLTAGRVFPWGDTPPSEMCDRAQWNNCRGDDIGSTRRVGSFPTGASGGLFDLAGNVNEWTADGHSPYSAMASSDPCLNRSGRQNPVCRESATGYRVIRGGSWSDGVVVAYLRSAARFGYAPVVRDSDLGFRCAGTVTE